MRAFWGCVAILAALGLWLVLDTGGRGGASDAPAAVDLVAPTADASGNDDARTASVDVAANPTNTAAMSDAASSAGASSATGVNAISASPTAANTGTAPLPGLDLFGASRGGVIPSAAPRTLRTDDRRPSEIVRRIDERTLELDGRFRLTGNGSDADPYLITWEMLTSASEYVDPAQNARTPPPWVRLLDGTYVEISGYYSTAVRVALAKNLLLTLNRWDGCCIGVPPTAFDAIDITVRDPLPMRGLHLTRFGTFKGLFRAECLDAAGFLIGLYRLEDATFETK
ncbi:MAG: hypothetical protein LW806_10705 [Planctomycetaceae bacterium]|nr:hypothetical protein [Planctomycetaceae bacterium]